MCVRLPPQGQEQGQGQGQGQAEWVCYSRRWEWEQSRAEWTSLLARKENQLLMEQSQGHNW